ncbi:MAG TPA: pitrilysin family protein [Methylomirabilota bacterium]|nr:pitrilysin family protein [Methylomirabilota bacterium]
MSLPPLVRARRKHPRTGVVLALVGLLAAGAAGRMASSDAPSPASALTAGVQETVLPNGLTVLVKEVRNAPVVSFSVWYRVGSRNEHTGITGVSHLLEHLLFKGTKQYRLGEIARTLFLNGASFNASTYYDWTNYYATIASDRLDLAMQIEADRMVNSRIDKADLDAEMTVVRSELEGGENSPGRLLWQAVVSTAFQAHPYRWPVIGWRSDVENVSRDSIYQYYRTHYGPGNAVAVVVGDVSAAEALRLVRRHFGSIKPIPKPPEVHTVEPPQRGERRVTVRRSGSLPMALIGWKAPAAHHPDAYALDVLAGVLGEGRTSRLYQALVEKGVASRVDAGSPSLRDPFFFYVSATARPGVTAEQLEAALLEEVRRATAAPITAEELARAQRRAEADFVFQTNSVTAQARQLGYWAMIGDWRYLTTYLDRIRALTPADIQAVAQRTFVTDTRTVGHFVPADGGGGTPPPPPREASARVDRPKRGDRPIALPRASTAQSSNRQVTRFALDNGISVIVQESHAVPTVALRASVPAGSLAEPQDRPGLAGFTAAMLSRGTVQRSALGFATALEDVGASLGAGADTLVTTITGQALTRDFDLVLDLFAEMLRQPAFPEPDLDRLKGEALAGIAQAKTNPDRVAGRAFERAVFPPGHPLRPETFEESEAAIAALTREDLAAFHRRQYGPDRMIVVVAGNVTPDQVREALQKRLGDWPRNPETRPIVPPDLPLQEASTSIEIPIPDKSQAAIVWGHAGGLRRSDPDFYAAQVLSVILGGGALTSRLGTAIRDDQGLAYSVFSHFDASLYPGPFRTVLGTNPTNARKAIAALEAEVQRIRRDGVTAREVDEVVAYLTGRFPLRLETNAGVAEILWAMEFFSLGADYIDRYAGYYRAVTGAQVNEAARTHLHPGRATVVVAGPLP